jgi:hypothetical protein
MRAAGRDARGFAPLLILQARSRSPEGPLRPLCTEMCDAGRDPSAADVGTGGTEGAPPGATADCRQ